MNVPGDAEAGHSRKIEHEGPEAGTHLMCWIEQQSLLWLSKLSKNVKEEHGHGQNHIK